MLVDLERVSHMFGAMLGLPNVPFYEGVTFGGNGDTATLGVKSAYEWTGAAGPRQLDLNSADIARATPENPWIFTVVDVGGGAGINSLTVITEGAELISGAASVSITTNFGGFTFLCDGSNLFVIASI